MTRPFFAIYFIITFLLSCHTFFVCHKAQYVHPGSPPPPPSQLSFCCLPTCPFVSAAPFRGYLSLIITFYSTYAFVPCFPLFVINITFFPIFCPNLHSLCHIARHFLHIR